MHTRSVRLLILAAACFVVGAPAAGAQSAEYSPGSAGIGDPYFPLEGNGGYDVGHYDLNFSYDPATDQLDALNKITATATQDLSRFDLDLQQLTVKGVEVNDEPATLHPRRPGAGHHAVHGDPGRLDVPRQRPLRRRRPRRSSARRSCSGRRTGSSTPTTARSWATNRTPRRRGSRSTTTRATRRPGRSA